MKKRLVLVGTLLASLASAQQNTSNSNPADLSNFKDIAAGSTLPTISSIATLKSKAESLVSSNCSDALPVLEQWATQSNWLSNLLAAGLEPYYSASSSDQRSVISSIRPLVPYETQANSYKEQRNLATVMRAECLVSLKKTNEAAAVYARALELISSSEMPLWNRAVNGLYKLIGVAPVNF